MSKLNKYLNPLLSISLVSALVLTYTNCAKSLDIDIAESTGSNTLGSNSDPSGENNSSENNNTSEDPTPPIPFDATISQSTYTVTEGSGTSVAINWTPLMDENSSPYNLSPSVLIYDPTNQVIFEELAPSLDGSLGTEFALDTVQMGDSGFYRVVITDMNSTYSKELSFSLDVQANPYLVNLQHVEAQCTAISGQIMTDQAGEKFCKFVRASCPAGWAQYNNWTATTTNSKNYTTGRKVYDAMLEEYYCARSTTGTCIVKTIHSFANTAPEQKTCKYTGTGGNFCSLAVTTVTAKITQVGCY